MATLWTADPVGTAWFIWIYDVLPPLWITPVLHLGGRALSVITESGPDQGRTLMGEGISDHIRYASHADEQGVLDGLYYVFPPH
jgi:hypothetical protein